MSLVVLEGLDGSGKSTQVQWVKDYLENHHITYRYLHFPETDSGVFGDLVARFLRGEFGELHQVNPYLVALLYAGDRREARDKIQQWLDNDMLVFVDRYVVSNIAFQCAKLSTSQAKGELKEWIYQLEYHYYNIPQPALSIFLDAPMDFVRNQLVKERRGNDRAYLRGKTDIHEADLDFQEQVREMYLWQASEDPNTQKIQCTTDDHQMLPPETIFGEILQTMQQYGIV